MISSASLSAFSAVNGVAPGARSGASAGATQVAGAAVDQLRGKSPPGGAQGLQGKPGQIQPGQLMPGQILPRGSLLDRSV